MFEQKKMNTVQRFVRSFHSSSMALGKKSPRQHRRGAMSAKRSPKNFYKGTGGRKEGRHTSKGGYVMDYSKTLNIIPPTAEHLSTFKLKPYVAQKTPKVTPSTLEVQ